MYRKAVILVPILILLTTSVAGDRRIPGFHGKKFAHAHHYWETAREEVYRSTLEVLQRHQAELKRGLRFHIFVQGDPLKKEVALTFDDGPHTPCTPRLLSLLKKYGIRATFFVVGEVAEENPGLVRAMAAAGHTLGNHTYHHVNLTKIPEAYIAAEIKACGEVLKDITGKPPRLFRPPGGDYNRKVAEVAEALGYTMVLWTDDPGDYARPSPRVIEGSVLGAMGNGANILLHDCVPETMSMLPSLIGYLRERGYRFVTIDEMMKEKHPCPTP